MVSRRLLGRVIKMSAMTSAQSKERARGTDEAGRLGRVDGTAVPSGALGLVVAAMSTTGSTGAREMQQFFVLDKCVGVR